MANHSLSTPSWLDDEYILQLLKKMKNCDLEIVSTEVVPASAVGDNFVCQVLRIIAVYCVQDEEESFQIIAKVTPQNNFTDTVGGDVKFFDVEYEVLSVLLPSLKRYLTTDFFGPEFYSVDVENAAIFIEDLKASHFEMQARGVYLTKTQCILTVEALADMHGSSWLAIQEDPGLAEKYSSTMWDGDVHELQSKLLDNAVASLTKFWDLYSELPEKYKKWLLKFKEIGTKAVMELKLKEDKMNFLLHGDCWMNNIMFRHNIDGDIDAAKLVDFQLVNYSHFSLDLIYLLISSAQTELIVQNLNEILEAYYFRLSKVAPSMPELSLERILTEFDEYFPFAIYAILIFRSFTRSKEPPDFALILGGTQVDMGFGNESYVSDLQELLPILESKGCISLEED